MKRQSGAPRAGHVHYIPPSSSMGTHAQLRSLPTRAASFLSLSSGDAVGQLHAPIEVLVGTVLHPQVRTPSSASRTSSGVDKALFVLMPGLSGSFRFACGAPFLALLAEDWLSVPETPFCFLQTVLLNLFPNLGLRRPRTSSKL